MKADEKFWYEWGDEAPGYVSVAHYSADGSLVSDGQFLKASVVFIYKFHCPYS
jgi:hypothetical protein